MSRGLLRRRVHQPCCLPRDPADMPLTDIPVNGDAGRRAHRRTKRNPTRLCDAPCVVAMTRNTPRRPNRRCREHLTYLRTGRFLLRPLVESTLYSTPKGVASNRNGHVSTTRPAVSLLWRLAWPHLRDRPHRLSAPHRTSSRRVRSSCVPGDDTSNRCTWRCHQAPRDRVRRSEGCDHAREHNHIV